MYNPTVELNLYVYIFHIPGDYVLEKKMYGDKLGGFFKSHAHSVACLDFKLQAIQF